MPQSQSDFVDWLELSFNECHSFNECTSFLATLNTDILLGQSGDLCVGISYHMLSYCTREITRAYTVKTRDTYMFYFETLVF